LKRPQSSKPRRMKDSATAFFTSFSIGRQPDGDGIDVPVCGASGPPCLLP
jgi:hypothetical protein